IAAVSSAPTGDACKGPAEAPTGRSRKAGSPSGANQPVMRGPFPDMTHSKTGCGFAGRCGGRGGDLRRLSGALDGLVMARAARFGLPNMVWRESYGRAAKSRQPSDHARELLIRVA